MYHASTFQNRSAQGHLTFEPDRGQQQRPSRNCGIVTTFSAHHCTKCEAVLRFRGTPRCIMIRCRLKREHHTQTERMALPIQIDQRYRLASRFRRGLRLRQRSYSENRKRRYRPTPCLEIPSDHTRPPLPTSSYTSLSSSHLHFILIIRWYSQRGLTRHDGRFSRSCSWPGWRVWRGGVRMDADAVLLV